MKNLSGTQTHCGNTVGFLFTILHTMWEIQYRLKIKGNMIKIKQLVVVVLAALALNGCLASSTSPIGVNCIPGTPFEDLPLACMGR